MKTTKRHFKVFKKECQKWIDKLELNTWEVSFILSEETNIYSHCTSALDRWRVVFGFCREWDDRVISISDKEIRGVAKHEVVHLLLARLCNYANVRFLTEDELILAEEELVRKLENIIK